MSFQTKPLQSTHGWDGNTETAAHPQASCSTRWSSIHRAGENLSLVPVCTEQPAVLLSQRYWCYCCTCAVSHMAAGVATFILGPKQNTFDVGFHGPGKVWTESKYGRRCLELKCVKSPPPPLNLSSLRRSVTLPSLYASSAQMGRGREEEHAQPGPRPPRSRRIGGQCRC